VFIPLTYQACDLLSYQILNRKGRRGVGWKSRIKKKKKKKKKKNGEFGD
jgi:hypothetical protein